MIPRIVHWNIISNCNLNCKFCYIYCEKSMFDTEGAKEVIEKIAKAGVKMLVLGGGDPLLREDIPELIEFSKSVGLITSLDTNAIEVKKSMVKRFEGSLDRIGFPLDGSTPEVHAAMRGRKQHFYEVLKAIKLFHKSNISIKINTLVTKLNVNDLLGIGKIIQKYGISLWSIFQFWPLEIGRAYREVFNVSNGKFLKVTKSIKHAYPDLKIEIAQRNKREKSYFLISPGGTVYTTPSNYGNEHIVLGNIIRDSIGEMWENSVINNYKHRKRYLEQLNAFV